MPEPIITGLASYGMSGEVFHAPLLHVHPGFSLKKIVERTTNKAKVRYPYVEIVRSYKELLADASIELVVVNTPDNTHFDFVRMALLAGKNVVVEKPFTLRSDEADKLISLAGKKKKLLSVFHNRRWDNDFRTVQKILDDKLLGRLVSYESRFDRYRNYITDSWKDTGKGGTGTLYNLGSHLIDQSLLLFGMPDAVFADIRKERDGAVVDDTYTIWLYYPQVRVTLGSSYLVREPGPRFTLHGTEGSYIKYGTDPQEQQLKDGHYPTEHGWGYEPKEKWGKLHTTINGVEFNNTLESAPGNYLQYYQSIFLSIRENGIPGVTAVEAANVIRVIEAAIKSHKKHKAITP